MKSISVTSPDFKQWFSLNYICVQQFHYYASTKEKNFENYTLICESWSLVDFRIGTFFSSTALKNEFFAFKKILTHNYTILIIESDCSFPIFYKSSAIFSIGFFQSRYGTYYWNLARNFHLSSNKNFCDVKFILMSAALFIIFSNSEVGSYWYCNILFWKAMWGMRFRYFLVIIPFFSFTVQIFCKFSWNAPTQTRKKDRYIAYLIKIINNWSKFVLL